MKQFLWIIVVVIATCSVHITMANPRQPNLTAEYIPVPTLFRSAFAGRPAPGYPKDPAAPSSKKEEDESEEDNLLDDEAVEGNQINTEDEGSEESDESNESRIKKSASSDESGSDEDDSDEDESDEDDDESDEDDDDDDDKPKRKPSRWRQTRYGSSFRIQAVGRPINYGGHHLDSRKPGTSRY